MKIAADKHGYRLQVLAEDVSYYGETKSQIIAFPTRDHKKLVAYVEDNRASIKQVFSLTDTWGVIASEIRDQFGFYQFGDTDKLKFFRDKGAVEAALISQGFAKHSQSWPKVLKLRNGTGKIGVYLAKSELETEYILRTSGFNREKTAYQCENI